MKFRLHWNNSLNAAEKYEIEHLNRNTGLGIKWWNNEWWDNEENIRWNYMIFKKDPLNFTAEILNVKFENENKNIGQLSLPTHGLHSPLPYKIAVSALDPVLHALRAHACSF